MHVKDLGINGSVYFTYVETGYTETFAEKLYLYFYYEGEIDFYELEDEAFESYFDYEEWEYYKEEGIRNAVQLATSTDVTRDLDTEIINKIDTLLDQLYEYEGDSFGLMVALGLVEEAENLDFSKGNKYKIAGTGTIEEDGTVFSVGAIRHKLLTAEENGVDYFFVPKDAEYYWDEEYSNEFEAEMVRIVENLQLEVVPVYTLYEAVEFLNQLD